MKAILITGLMSLISFGVSASTFTVKSLTCEVQRDNNVYNEFDTYTFKKVSSGLLSTQLPDGVVATFESFDSGFNVVYHQLTITLGDLTVTQTGTTQKVISGKVDNTIIRNQGTIAGRRFICDAIVLPKR